MKLSADVEFNAAGIPVKRWTYEESGLTVCLVQKKGPIVHGFLVLATEAHDDDGLPHTLEHLIFLGSEEYPYKGVLDTLANRCFARGTNAWTATDHTCYTASHAGAAGFLTLLPVYLDHILYPTITPAGYHTEVYHVTGTAEDAGVVYCEMQARENTGYSLTEYELQQLMHPNDGYKSETGGRMANLRDSCSHQKVKDYHSQFYRPDGCCLVVVGDVTREELHKTLEPSLAKFASKGSLPPKERAWGAAAMALSENKEVRLKFPSDDESTGLVRVGWSLCPYGDGQFVTQIAVAMLLQYLTDTSVADLQKAFVECEDPLATGVYPRIDAFNPAQASLLFVSCPTEKLSDIKPLLFKVLGEVADGTAAIQMPRMQSVLTRMKLNIEDQAENQPEDLFLDVCIPNFLYDVDGSKLSSALKEMERLDCLLAKDALFWSDLAKRMLVEAPCVVVIGEPSAAKGKENEAAESGRVEARKKQMEDEGLKAAAEALAKAQEENDSPFPDSVLEAFPLPSVDAIGFHGISTTRSTAFVPQHPQNLEGTTSTTSKLSSSEAAAIAGCPLAIQVDEIESEFISLKVCFRTDDLSDDERLLLPMLMGLLLESPVQRPEGLVGWEDVVQELADTTLETESSIGLSGDMFACGQCPQVASVSAKCQKNLYLDTVRLLSDCIFRSVPTAERMKVQANKALNSIPGCKRNGNRIVSALLYDSVLSMGHNKNTNNFLRQGVYLTALVEKLGQEPEKVCADVASLRKKLFGCKTRMRIHLSGSAANLRLPPGGLLSPFTDSFILAQDEVAGSSGPPPPPLSDVASKASCQLTQTLLQDHFLGKGRICAVSSVESGFLRQVACGVKDRYHADVAALQVAMNYLTCLEGPFWKEIRGAGLSYSYSMSLDGEEGLLNFSLFKSTNLVAAYAKAEAIVRGFATGETPVKAVELETAISTTIYAVVNRECTPAEAAYETFFYAYQGMHDTYNREMIQKVRAVSIADVARVMKEYFVPLFDPSTSTVAICCNPGKLDDVLAGFEAHGRALQVTDLDVKDVKVGLGAEQRGCDCMRCVVPSFLTGKKMGGAPPPPPPP